MLRLQKEGRVRPAIWWVEPARPEDAYGSQSVRFGQRGLEFASPAPGSYHDMSAEDLAEAADLLAKYERKAEDAVFDFALRRFDLAHERVDDTDRLVDHWISLEALFGRTQKGQVRGDLTYRLTTRIPRFLREGQSDRVKLQKELRRLYTARSNVVHGTPDDPVRTAAAAQTTEQYAREALKRWLTVVSPPTLEDLDFGPHCP